MAGVLLDDVLGRMAETFPDQTAYSVVDGGSMTFSEWDGEANRLARGLVARGIVPDDRVAVHLGLDNALRWMVAYAAVHRAGGVAVPLSPRLTAAEVARMLAHCGARGSVADGDLAPTTRSWTWPWWSDASLGPRSEAGLGAAAVPWDEALDPDGSPLGVQRSRARPGRHPLHLGHHRAPQGGGRPPRQRLDGPPRPTPTGTAAPGCTPARCTPSPGWPSSTTR